ncbi:WecB/TagA/CpsF family glycosyltransferase [Curtobacterium sp. NPDC089185]|uniref:WecB/TagA/CpsF family glycosyltransferase n=1 Tax=Curtobacterium sp. NPDC089185 TaxID=3154968 RepID=UPI0034188E02
MIALSQTQHEGAAIHLLNAYSIALAQSDTAFRASLTEDSCNFPDGKPLSWVTRWSTERLHQVRGPQFFADVLDQGRDTAVKHFLLGGSDDLLVRLQENLHLRYPGLSIVGAHSPPFRALTSSDIAQQDALIRASDADIVWVGLGTPKQDFEVARLARELGVVACAVGAAFDFAAGTKREAPRWMTKVGLEWLYRLLAEPKRLWRRYLIGNFIFLRAVLRDH